MILAAVDPTPLVALVSLILGGSGVGAIIAFRKAGPEVEAISVTTLRGVIQEMRDELERKDRIIGDLNHQIGKQGEMITQLTTRVSQLEVEPPPHLA